MRVHWLHESLTIVAVTRGILRRRRAVIERVETVNEYGTTVKRWHYVNSGVEVDYSLSTALDSAQAKEQKRQQRALDWQPLRRRRSLPVVRT